MRKRQFPSNREPYPENVERGRFEYVLTSVEKEVEGIIVHVPVLQKITLPREDPNVGITVDDFDPIELSKAGYNVKSGVVDRGFTDVESALDKIS